MTGQRVGYIRLSSLDQNPDRQPEGVDVERVFTDRASGRDVVRPQLEALVGFVRGGDTVVVHSLDRLARNLDDLRRLVSDLTARGVSVHFVHEQLSFTGEDSPMANLLLSVMGAFAEFERALIRERQREGIALASSEAPTGAVADPSPTTRSTAWRAAPRPASPRPPSPESSPSAARPSTSTCGPGPRRLHDLSAMKPIAGDQLSTRSRRRTSRHRRQGSPRPARPGGRGAPRDPDDRVRLSRLERSGFLRR